eukprot:TRINITY_DN7235_c0_g1_i1.p1 TRINITY_DN7235_c0_g1~~TRINITY_DN7235_c0_g1_i1.p1  ORF type:complete len:219 (+),score=82.64 TRINITY_DN7235_c0_g1_i1:218-874(+)
MMKLFGTARAAPTPTETIDKLQATLELMEKREVFLQKKIEKEVKFAQQNATKNRRGALMALKRKKSYEQQIERLLGARMTLEQQQDTIHNAQMNLKVFDAMKAGAQTIKREHRNMSIDDVDDIMDDIREQMDVAEEISNAISQPLGTDMFDEDELEAELEELENQNIEEELLSARVTTSSLPSVPNTGDSLLSTPSVPDHDLSEDDKELAALEAEMAM